MKLYKTTIMSHGQCATEPEFIFEDNIENLKQIGNNIAVKDGFVDIVWIGGGDNSFHYEEMIVGNKYKLIIRK